MAAYYQVVIDGMKADVDYMIFRSHIGPRFRNGKPYTGPVYVEKTHEEYVESVRNICADCGCILPAEKHRPNDVDGYCNDCQPF